MIITNLHHNYDSYENHLFDEGILSHTKILDFSLEKC